VSRDRYENLCGVLAFVGLLAVWL